MSDSDSDSESDETLENVLQNYGEDITELVLVRRDIIGTIPPVLGNLTNLVKLNLDDNKLTGTIPPELGKLINLTALHIEGNELTGHIPPELGQLTNLKVLSLTRNELLTGAIPGTLSKLTNLGSLSLEGTKVTKVQHGTELVGNWGTNNFNIDDAERPHRKISRLFEEIRNQTTGLMAVYKIKKPQLPPEVIINEIIKPHMFGKIIKPYKKHLSRVDDKGAYFNTRFGVQKLRDDERGLYLKNGKGVRLYLYEW